MFKEGAEWRRSPRNLRREGGRALQKYYLRGPEFLVTPVFMGPVCLI